MSDQYSMLKEQYEDTWDSLHKANEEVDELRAQLAAQKREERDKWSGLRKSLVTQYGVQSIAVRNLDRHAPPPEESDDE